MNIILWRHAEAEDSLNDMSRKLTERGHAQARSMATFLRKHLPADTRILASPAVRAQQTVTAFTHNFITLPALAPGASAQAILQAADWPGAGGNVLVVGHQPTLGAVAAQLLDSNNESLRIKKSGLWWLSCRAVGAEVTLRLVLTPDFL